jgi:two-component sensor histidine kinase
MRWLSSAFISLQIGDDGVGIQSGSEWESHSLGMTLMKSIGQKLGGIFTIQSSDKGVLVTLEFKPEPLLTGNN